MLSIAILSRTEKFLNNTIKSILENATGEIEILPVLDAYGGNVKELISHGIPYEPIIDPRVKYIVLPNNGQLQKRQGINTAVSISKGEYVAWCDAHCAFAKGFDEMLIKDCQDNWVVFPRRHRMDVENWTGTSWNKPPIDYEYIMWQFLIRGRFSGYKWENKTREKMDVPIDDVMTKQASFVLMKKSWFKKMGFMNVDRYTGWGQEEQEIIMETWRNGGRVIVNKNTWYAHLHKGKTFGRMYPWNREQVYKSYELSYKYWTQDQREFLLSYFEKFMPIPNFPKNWKELLIEKWNNESVL